MDSAKLAGRAGGGLTNLQRLDAFGRSEAAGERGGRFFFLGGGVGCFCSVCVCVLFLLFLRTFISAFFEGTYFLGVSETRTKTCGLLAV